jgi:hypothetical protein
MVSAGVCCILARMFEVEGGPPGQLGCEFPRIQNSLPRLELQWIFM